jgi:hypothetical protein
MAIELPGYRTLLANQVFEKRAAPYVEHGRHIELTNLVKVYKLRVSTETEIIDFIKAGIRGFNQKNTGFMINHYLSMLSETARHGILEGDEELTGLLKRSFTPPRFPHGSSHIIMNNSIVPTHILERMMENSPKDSDYDIMMGREGHDNWFFALRLNNGTVPRSAELGYLFNRNVRKCDLFEFSPSLPDYQQAVKEVKLMHASIKSPEAISQLKDATPEFLEGEAISTLKNSIEHVVSERFAHNLIDSIVASVGENAERSSAPPRNPFSEN